MGRLSLWAKRSTPLRSAPGKSVENGSIEPRSGRLRAELALGRMENDSFLSDLPHQLSLASEATEFFSYPKTDFAYDGEA